MPKGLKLERHITKNNYFIINKQHFVLEIVVCGLRLSFGTLWKDETKSIDE